jgi:hypothetical protein
MGADEVNLILVVVQNCKKGLGRREGNSEDL